MNEFINPKASHIPRPVAAYSHCVKVPADAEWLVISGQIGIDPNGRLLDGARMQAEQAFRNILACLKESGMGKKDLVKITTFLTDPRHIDAFRVARKKVIGDATKPAATLLIVDGLASPDMVTEIEAIAAKG